MDRLEGRNERRILTVGLLLIAVPPLLLLVLSALGYTKGGQPRAPNLALSLVIFVIGGILLISRALGERGLPPRSEGRGPYQTTPKVKVLARFAIDRKGAMVTDPFSIEIADSPRFYVQIANAGKMVEHECSEEVYHQCGEGMSGRAETRGKRLSHFSPSIGTSGEAHASVDSMPGPEFVLARGPAAAIGYPLLALSVACVAFLLMPPPLGYATAISIQLDHFDRNTWLCMGSMVGMLVLFGYSLFRHGCRIGVGVCVCMMCALGYISFSNPYSDDHLAVFVLVVSVMTVCHWALAAMMEDYALVYLACAATIAVFFCVGNLGIGERALVIVSTITLNIAQFKHLSW